jgi:hypothetical protein
MVGLRAATLLLTFGVSGADAPPAPSATAPAAPSPATDSTPKRPAPPAPPVEYLRAGAKLFNQRKYELAGKYLEAAYRYRDRLSRNEQIVLDVYLDELENYRNQLAGRPSADTAVEMAGASATEPPGPIPIGQHGPNRAKTDDKAVKTSVVIAPSGMASPAAEKAPAQAPPVERPARPGDPLPAVRNAVRFDTTDTKQKARWLLQCAREQAFRGQFDEAEKFVAEARGLNVKWGFFDETPDKVDKAIEKARRDADEAKAQNATTDSNKEPPR